MTFKHIFSLLLILSVSMGAYSKDTLRITGSLTGYPDNTLVILKNLDTQKNVDTAFIRNNQFSLSVLKSDPVPHGLFIGIKNDYLFMWLEDADITVTGVKDHFREAAILGGKVQSQTNDLFLLTRRLTNQFDSLNVASRKALENNDAEKAKSLDIEMDRIIYERIGVGAGYIKENPGNLLSAFTLVGYIPGLPKSEIELLYENLSPEIKKSRYAKSVADFLRVNKEVAIGDFAGNFQLPDLSGNTVSLKDYKGKYVLLDFWASGCAPCRIENKTLVRNYKKYRGRGFEIISVTADRNKDLWASATREDKITWASLASDVLRDF